MNSESRLSRRDFLRLSAAGLAAAEPFWGRNGEAFAEAYKKPNFIIFYTDDQGIGDLSAYGAADIPTPNMDALAASGVRFTNWYSASPVCSPSRAALLTGRYPQRTGVSRILSANRNSPGLYADEITIARALKAAGYRTALFGKWHLGTSSESRPNAQGFDEFYGFLGGCIDYYSHIMYWEMGSGLFPVHDLWKNSEEVWENGTYFTDIITRESLRFIRENSSKPFFLYVAYNSPHYPMHAPREYFERFPNLESHRRQQAAMVATVDDSMGRILELIKKQGLVDNTVIFFQSDNGATIEKRCLFDGSGEFYHGGSNEPYRGYKGGLYEGGIHMPAILSWPGLVPKGAVSDRLGCAIDILPTFLNMAQVPVPTDRVIDGRNIMPMILSLGKSPHKLLFWELGEQLALREGKWKLILDGKESFEKNDSLPEVFLADLEADPEEKLNLAGENPEVVKRLTDLCRKMKEDLEKKRYH